MRNSKEFLNEKHAVGFACDGTGESENDVDGQGDDH